jgi:hypothetical protein
MVVGHVGLRGQGSPSAKLGTVAVVINRTAASTSRSFFTVFLLLKRIEKKSFRGTLHFAACDRTGTPGFTGFRKK